MFPSINVSRARLNACQRVVLLAHDKETGALRFDAPELALCVGNGLVLARG